MAEIPVKKETAKEKPVVETKDPAKEKLAAKTVARLTASLAMSPMNRMKDKQIPLLQIKHLPKKKRKLSKKQIVFILAMEKRLDWAIR